MSEVLKLLNDCVRKRDKNERSKRLNVVRSIEHTSQRKALNGYIFAI